MASFEWILQPPQSHQYTFLVDDLNPSATYGLTTDPDKFNYNRGLMGVNFNLEVGMNTALAKEGVSAVLPLGRYVTIFQISGQEDGGSMTFLDYQINLSPPELKTLLSGAFAPELVTACMELKELLRADFSPSDDIVRLEKI
ncbi:hypothetical protein ACFSUS_27715 [Spirosoma soli]|uniref:SRPBCC family protein n=1 Tax=Spirosoma soli TaxID=1770529 RepID=A0ABW5ME17_9BACT